MSAGNALHALALETCRARCAQLEVENDQLRAELTEYLLDSFLQLAYQQPDGGYTTGGLSTTRDLGDWLVEHAGWTRRPGGVGRTQTYDPPSAGTDGAE